MIGNPKTNYARKQHLELATNPDQDRLKTSSLAKQYIGKLLKAARVKESPPQIQILHRHSINPTRNAQSIKTSC